MYMDTDSIMYQNGNTEQMRVTSWFSSVEGREMNREELCLLYGCWADDAARSGFLQPMQGTDRKTCAYAA